MPRKSRTKRRILTVAAVVLLLAGGFVALRYYVFGKLDVSIQRRLTSLSVSGFNVHYDSLSVDWWSNVIKVDKLVLEKNAYDTTCIYPEFISVSHVRAEGVGLFGLIFRSTLALESVYLDGLRVVLRQNSLLQIDSAAEKDQEFSLIADHVLIRAGDLTYTDSAACRIITGVQTDLAIAGLRMNFKANQPLAYEADIVTLNKAEVRAPKHLYTFNIEQLNLNFNQRALTLDSIQIVPHYGQVAFGRKHGFEIDRFEGVIPFLRATDFSFSFLDSSWVKTGAVEMQFFLKVFRDKRLRFVRKKKLLPVAQLRELPFALKIDTIRIKKSYVQYEEFAEGTNEPGRIFFDNFYATLTGIDNRSRAGSFNLTAASNLLGDGALNLHASFPLEENKRATVTGSIEDFSLPEINPMLVPSARIKIESGTMKKLSFDFRFNQTRSDGKLELNYENLKLITFKDDDKAEGDELEKDGFKTFMMNTFIFRTDMDEDVPEEKRTGTIQYVRDDVRSVFNYWVKSLLSGIKSAYNLDKAEAKKSEREIKKEERSLRREARRQRRADRKKARG